MINVKSLERLNTCHPFLRRVVLAVAEEMKIQVICGYRGKEEQDRAFGEGKSKLKFPKSKHNIYPSEAVDLAPLKMVDGKLIIDWNDKKAFQDLANCMFKYAYKFGIGIRWGGDFNMDGTKTTNDAWDLPHWELRESKG